ncbi:MAG: methyltransferase domain-containing protein [Chloroflexi bacterium]|nr:methyltransferase domain-containing protein [Chloroflexota bacterium]
MENDLYSGIADRYDLFDDKFGIYSPVIINFYRKLFTKNNVHSVLDCACGTGKDLPLFHSLGCEVYGTDLSAAMLSQAHKNLNQLNLNIPLERLDYRELPQHFERQFDAITCLSSSLEEMPDENEVLRAFGSMHKVLRSGGILIMSQGTTDKQWKEKPRFIPAVIRPDFSRVFVIDYLEQGAVYNILDIFHSEGKSDFNVWSRYLEHIYLRDDLDRLLKSSGFSSVYFYGSYRFDPYDKETSDKLITVAIK